MKNILFFLYSLLCKLFSIGCRHNDFSGTKLWLFRVKQSKGTTLSLRDASIVRSTLSINGADHIIRADGAVLNNCEVRVDGTANTIVIEPSCNIRNMVLVVNGNNCRVTIGKSTRVGSMYMVCMGDGNYISVGEDCMIADYVDIWATDAHPILDSKGEVCNPSKPIEIGNHVWLGKYAKVLKGVTIHDNAIVGMNTMVTKNVPANTLVVGADCRAIKKNVNWDRKFLMV